MKNWRRPMRNWRTTLVTGLLAAGVLVAVATSLGCASNKKTGNCCNSSGLCFCYEGQSCESGETAMSSCPAYTYCCQENSSDFCTCSNLLTCSAVSSAIGSSTSSVSGCP
jgi:hypothetical protein